MLSDCDTCTVRGDACCDCVMTVLLDVPPDGVEIDDDEHAAIGTLARAGLLPPLRLVPVHRPPNRDIA
jgi:hypothetical protein